MRSRRDEGKETSDSIHGLIGEIALGWILVDNPDAASLDELAARERRSRSAIVETILKDFCREQRQAELARQAAAFFAQPEGPDEIEERADWERLSAEVLRREQ